MSVGEGGSRLMVVVRLWLEFWVDWRDREMDLSIYKIRWWCDVVISRNSDSWVLVWGGWI